VSASVTFVGGEEAMADMRRWADQVAPAVAKASEPFARRVADLVAGRVPVLSGQLASSVEASADEEGAAVTMGEGLAYAGWIEFGGSRGRPHVPEGRYLYPTALEAQDEFGEVAAEAAADSVGRFSWSTPSL
jgi:phage gpG-like protein